DAIDREVLGKDPHDLRLEGFVALGTCRQPRGIPALGNTLMIGGWGDWQDAADRLDPIMPTMLVDKGDHRFSGRSSSAWAKYAEALRRISLACRSSRFSRSRALSFSATSLGTPARRPPSTSAFFTQSFRVWAEQPIFWETETTAAQRDGYSPPCSSTIRTARVRTSGENLFVVLLIRLYPTWELEPPTVPVRFTPLGPGKGEYGVGRRQAALQLANVHFAPIAVVLNAPHFRHSASFGEGPKAACRL